MTGAPGLFTALRNRVTGRQLVNGLMDISNVEILFHTIANDFPERFFHLRLDDKDQIPEACTPGIKQRKVDNDMALFIYRGDLLEAAEPAAHASRHNYKRRFFHNKLLYCTSKV